MGQLLRHIKASYSSRTGILNDIFATDGGHPILSQVSKQCISEVLTRRVHCFTFPVNDLPVEALPLQNTQVSTSTHQHLVKLMSPNKPNRHLFPGGRLVVDWIPLRTDPHNVPFMNSNACYHTGKYPEQECLSFGTGYQCKLGLAYNLDIYGSHPKSLRAHVHRHLLEIAHSVQRNQGH
ncbi:uncharacterized protein LOC124120966 [Haliotis rufescens]|uniref:uncharacterized protein LOC124120966 n=1 Tax=Haliotis rufescens TaxID=6454 RepID=UPI00201F70B5|nr:uncharacterized protein LOC124120966 [Haliotis rufescens]